jgi:hypothetical protein
MYLNFKAYLGEIWNFIDIIRVLMLLYYCGSGLLDNDLDETKEGALYFKYIRVYSLAALNLISYIRVFSFFRLNQKSRVLIRLVIEVTKDMIPFMSLLVVGVFAFATTFNVVKSADSSSSETLITTIGQYYRLIYGDFNLLDD